MIVSGVKNNPLVNLQEQFSLSMTPFCLNQVQNVLYIYNTIVWLIEYKFTKSTLSLQYLPYTI